jgi:PQQ-dependent catabolism-associated CXXCW motif protein
MRTLAVFGAAVLLIVCSGARADNGPVPEPQGYRLDNYRAPVPLTVAGGKAIGTEDAKALWTSGRAVFIDVLPAPRRPEGLAPGAVWKPLPRLHVPGSLWLPDVGRGEINERLDSYFRDNLEHITGSSKAAPLVFYCLADCWMSWNAARRAISYGYTQVYWYRDGTDGWTKAQLPTEAGTPAPGWP